MLLHVIMMMMSCFCGMVDRRKAFSLISSRYHWQGVSPSQISNTPQRIWIRAELQFSLFWMKLCSSDNHCVAIILLPIVGFIWNYLKWAESYAQATSLYMLLRQISFQQSWVFRLWEKSQGMHRSVYCMWPHQKSCLRYWKKFCLKKIWRLKFEFKLKFATKWN